MVHSYATSKIIIKKRMNSKQYVQIFYKRKKKEEGADGFLSGNLKGQVSKY